MAPCQKRFKGKIAILSQTTMVGPFYNCEPIDGLNPMLASFLHVLGPCALRGRCANCAPPASEEYMKCTGRMSCEHEEPRRLQNARYKINARLDKGCSNLASTAV